MNCRLYRRARLSNHPAGSNSTRLNPPTEGAGGSVHPLKLLDQVQGNIIRVLRMAGGNDFLGQQAPIGERSLGVAVIIQLILSMAFFTAQHLAGIMLQPKLGRAETDFDSLRVHACDYPRSGPREL